jgi:hypothetical protein
MTGSRSSVRNSPGRPDVSTILLPLWPGVAHVRRQLQREERRVDRHIFPPLGRRAALPDVARDGIWPWRGSFLRLLRFWAGKGPDDLLQQEYDGVDRALQVDATDETHLVQLVLL